MKPVEGFPVNQLAIKLVSLQPKEIFRGDNIESLKSNLSTIELLLSRISTVAESGEIKINEYLNKVKIKKNKLFLLILIYVIWIIFIKYILDMKKLKNIFKILKKYLIL